MENNNYNSLANKLIQSGIIQNSENFFEDFCNNSKKTEEVEKEQETIVENPINESKSKKRINKYDLELIGSINNSDEFLKKSLIEKLLFKFFPKLYKAFLVKNAMKKLFELNIDEKMLFNKTIPYGENEVRYRDLIKYLNYANELQVKLGNKD